MRRSARVVVLAIALVAIIALTVMLFFGAYRSPVVPVGQARAEQLQRAIDELQSDVDLTKDQVRRIVRGLCATYPELRGSEVCRAGNVGH